MSDSTKSYRSGIIDGINTKQEIPQPELYWSDEKWLPDNTHNNLYIVLCTERTKYGAGTTYSYLCEFSYGVFRVTGNLTRIIETKGWYTFRWAKVFV